MATPARTRSDRSARPRRAEHTARTRGAHMTSPPAPDHQWRWRQPPGPGWATWQGNLPGPLGDDGGVILLGRRAQGPSRCITCGRHAQLWHATVLLPRPFPVALDADAGGCTRAHATHAVSTSWGMVA